MTGPAAPGTTHRTQPARSTRLADTSDSHPVAPSQPRSVGPLVLRSYYFFFFAVLGYSIPFINLFFEKTLHFSGKQIGSITAVRLMMAVVVPPIWGILSDKLRGPRFLMAIGLGTSAVALILFGAVALYWQALLLMGIFAFFSPSMMDSRLSVSTE